MDFFSLNQFQLNTKLEGKWQYIIFGCSLSKRESKRKTSKHKGDRRAHPDNELLKHINLWLLDV